MSSAWVRTADSSERPLLSLDSFLCRLKRRFVSADHWETPALPSALMRTNNRHAMYPNTRLVEIHTDKAARSRVSMLRNVPKWKIYNPSLRNAYIGNVPNNPMIITDVTKAAHRLVKVVDATTNTVKPLCDVICESRAERRGVGRT